MTPLECARHAWATAAADASDYETEFDSYTRQHEITPRGERQWQAAYNDAAMEFDRCYREVRAIYDATPGTHEDKLDRALGWPPDEWILTDVLEAVGDVLEKEPVDG